MLQPGYTVRSTSRRCGDRQPFSAVQASKDPERMATTRLELRYCGVHEAIPAGLLAMLLKRWAKAEVLYYWPDRIQWIATHRRLAEYSCHLVHVRRSRLDAQTNALQRDGYHSLNEIFIGDPQLGSRVHIMTCYQCSMSTQ